MVAKAKLTEVEWKDKSSPPVTVKNGVTIDAHFNPQNLKLTYANENKGDNQSKGASQQHIGSGTTKLAVELLFDTTRNSENGKDQDVRKLTEKIAYFMKPKNDPKTKKPIPPGVSFEWGSFNFAGIVDSLQITLDYFSEEGIPLRATLSLNITGIDTIIKTKDSAQNNLPGTSPKTTVQNNDNLAKISGVNGNSSDWKAIAVANNIDNPLRLKPGSLLDLNATANARVGVSLGGQGSLSASAGLSGGVGFNAGLGGGAGFSAGASAGIGASGGAGAGIGGGIGAGFGANAGVGAGLNANLGGGLSTGIGANAGFNANGGGTFGASARISGSAGGVLGGSAGGRASVQGSIGGGFGVGVDKPGR